MRAGILGICLVFASALFAREEENFGRNQWRFISQHLPNLLDDESGKVLLIGTYDLIYPSLCNKFPLIEFKELPLWNKNAWNKTIEKQNWNGTFDCVIATNILERDPDREQTVTMIFDLLKQKGKVLMYIDPQDQSFDQKVENAVLNSSWKKRISIIPSLSLSEHQLILEKAGFSVLDQAPDEYRIYFESSRNAFWAVLLYTCPRWPVPKTEEDEELFAEEVRDRLTHHREVIPVPYSCPIFNNWIEETLQTYYFILQK